MFKRIRNTRRKGNKVSARYKYISDKAEWIAGNTAERFDFAVKRMFKDKQDTTHFIFSFRNLLNEQETEEARKRILSYFDKLVGDEHFYTIAEHTDNGHTHYHILISRNLITNKMFDLKAKEFYQVKKEINKLFFDLMDTKDIEAFQKYERRLNDKTKKAKNNLSAFEYKDYKNNKYKVSSLLPKREDFQTKKAFLKAFNDDLIQLIKDKMYNEIAEEFALHNYDIKIEYQNKRRRFYLYQGDEKIGRLDRLGDFNEKIEKIIKYAKEKLKEKENKTKIEKSENKEIDKDKALLNEIKQKLDLNLLLRYVEDHYNFDTSKYEINDIDNRIRPRGSTKKGKNAIDFLIKDLKLKMAEAFDIVKSLYQQQQQQEPEVVRINIHKPNRDKGFYRKR